MELKNEYKNSVTTFKTTELIQDGEFIVLELENISESYEKRYNTIVNYMSESIPIWFTYYSVDEIDDEFSRVEVPNKYIIRDYVNDQNIFVEYIPYTIYSKKYKLYIKLTKFPHLKSKILTNDYNLICYYTDAKTFIIMLDYKPNMRKIKIKRLKYLISKNRKDYVI